MHAQAISSFHTLFASIMILSASLPFRRIAAFNCIPSRLSRATSQLNGVICHMSATKDSYHYNSLKVSELRELLRENGMPVTGIKAELIERLTEANIKNEGNIDDEKVPSNLQFLQQTGDSEDWDDEIIADEDEENDNGGFDPNHTVFAKPKAENTSAKTKDKETRLKKHAPQDDFQSTRVFVQGIPQDATWQDLKDHFQIIGQVAFASISVDRRTGESKGCGIVQYETTEMAAKAIKEMRNNPMNGATLYVRKDVQENRNGKSDDRLKRPQRSSRNENDDKVNLPSEWRRANDEEDGKKGQCDLDPEELEDIVRLVEKRDSERRKRNYQLSDSMREELKAKYGVHVDDTLKLWWTDVNGEVPGVIAEIKGDGRWGKQQPWRQIPTTPECDAQVDPERVFALLNKRDKARQMKDFKTADALLQLAYESPKNGLGMRIHDQSRTWRIWTEAPPPKKGVDGSQELTAEEMCLKLVQEYEPDKVHEVKFLLKKFPGREWQIFKKIKARYES